MKRKYKSLIIFFIFQVWIHHKQICWIASKQKTVDTAKLKKINNNH